VRFVGTGERLDALEAFVPARVAQRILGMGDVVGLVEKVQETVDQKVAEEAAERMFRDTWTLEDFRVYLGQFRALSAKSGGLAGLVKLVPGMAQIPTEALENADEGKFARFEAAISSMTPAERADPTTLHAQRRARVARGSGTSVAVVNELLKSFKMARKQMKEVRSKGLLGRLAGRQMDRMKEKQIRELKRRGVDLRDWFPGT
jgi:signal recognition particle subunit SRP54